MNGHAIENEIIINLEKLDITNHGIMVYADQSKTSYSDISDSIIGSDNKAVSYTHLSKALRFARERYNLGGGDRDRGKNQMRVITGIINKAISPSIITNYTSTVSYTHLDVYKRQLYRLPLSNMLFR